MSDVKEYTVNCSLPILQLLGVAFVVLKLTNVINWSWWWVLLPFYSIPLLMFVVFVVGFIFGCCRMLMNYKNKMK